MERQSNKNPWAEKLQEVSLPEAGEAWNAMAAILDKEMPVDRKRRRRWLLLILVLPVLAGAGYFGWEGRNTNSPVSTHGGHLPPSTGNPAASGSGVKRSSSSGQAALPGQSPVVGRVAEPSPVPAPTAELSPVPAHATELSPVESARVKGARAPVTQQRGLRRSDPGSIVPLDIAGAAPIGMEIGLSPARNNLKKATAHSNDPLKCPPVERPKTAGLVVGIGLNQSFPVNGQQVWTNPSDGLNRWWEDYIPVPFARYYFQPKVFVQVEARIHAPQYTPKDLWFAYLYNNYSFSGPVFIKKLFYFQVPVSIHYAPAPNWSIGLGLQYSHYGKGIAAIADSSITNVHFAGALSDFPMVSVQHNEFRGLVSLDYSYRRWIIGTSYDEAFTRAVSARVGNLPPPPSSTFTELPPPVRNSSLQVYLRYILWDGRKKK